MYFMRNFFEISLASWRDRHAYIGRVWNEYENIVRYEDI